MKSYYIIMNILFIFYNFSIRENQLFQKSIISVRNQFRETFFNCDLIKDIPALSVIFLIIIFII